MEVLREYCFVIPAKVGIQVSKGLDTGLRRCDESYQTFYPTHFRALLNVCSHRPFSPHLSGRHEFCTVRNTRSGWRHHDRKTSVFCRKHVTR